MPTEKPRVSFALSEDLLKQIDDFKYENRIKNQSQAIIALINRGFEAIAGTQADANALNMDEQQLIVEYRAAPEPIKEAAHNILAPYIASRTKNRA